MHRCFVRLFPLLRLGCPLSAPPTGPPRRRRVYHAGNLPFVVEAEANNVVVLHFPLSSASGAHFRPTIGHPRLKSVEHAGICLALWGMKATTAVFLHVLLSSAWVPTSPQNGHPRRRGVNLQDIYPLLVGKRSNTYLFCLHVLVPPPPVPTLDRKRGAEVEGSVAFQDAVLAGQGGRTAPCRRSHMRFGPHCTSNS